MGEEEPQTLPFRLTHDQTCEEQDYHMCCPPRKMLSQFFLLPPAQPQRLWDSDVKKFHRAQKILFFIHWKASFFPNPLENWTGLLRTPVIIINFSQLSANIFVVWTFLLRTIMKLDHFLYKEHSSLPSKTGFQFLCLWSKNLPKLCQLC